MHHNERFKKDADSQFNNNAGMQMMGRFNNLDGFGPGEFDDDRDINIAGATGQQ